MHSQVVVLTRSGTFDFESLPQETRDMLKVIRGDTPLMQLDTVWKELQNHIDHVLDREMNQSSRSAAGWGFKQLIERKQGANSSLITSLVF